MFSFIVKKLSSIKNLKVNYKIDTLLIYMIMFFSVRCFQRDI